VQGFTEDLTRLVAGDQSAWSAFVERYAGLVNSAVRAVAGQAVDIEDIVQDVYVRLCKDDFRLLRLYDPARSRLSTWLTIVARSAAHDALRKRSAITQSIDDTPETSLAVDPVIPEHVKIPDGLLSPRQQLVLTMLYQREMDVSEIALELSVDPQTVRSMHHKALVKLRAHFKDGS
jgi:RNA polymerase sigma-70 factor (ECF subfamily)